jgi:type I restriction enzyme, S subunit
VYDGPEPMAFAGYLVRGRVSDRYSPEYISAYLNSRWGKQKLRGMCKSIVGMANINAQEFAGISIAIPSSETQRRFARLVSGMRARKRDLREQMRAFDRLFSALQSNAFSEA